MSFPEKAEWMRVSKNRVCAACKKDSWCTFTEEVICCMRIQSAKPAKNGGWIHRLTEKLPKHYFHNIKPSKPKMDIDFEFMFRFVQKRTTNDQIRKLAVELGLLPVSLKMIGYAWDEETKAHWFPMKDAQGKIIGIRTRYQDGSKRAVSGSRAGLFIPDVPTDGFRQIYVCEGVSDVCALLSMGLYAIGRPSCLGSEDLLMDALKNSKIRDIVLICDNDTPGINGMMRLSDKMIVKHRVWIPPSKDCREFLIQGGSADLIESLTRNLIWTVPASKHGQ